MVRQYLNGKPMTFRLYYWFDGAPVDRPGGPWWYRDFSKAEERDWFLLNTRPFLRRWAETHGEWGKLPDHNPMKIQPSKDLTLYRREGGSWNGHIMHYRTVAMERT